MTREGQIEIRTGDGVRNREDRGALHIEMDHREEGRADRAGETPVPSGHRPRLLDWRVFGHHAGSCLE